MCTPIIGQLVTENLVQGYIENGLGVSFKGLGAKWDTEEDVKNVVSKIRSCENLKYLELEGNTLGVDAAKAIGKALESKPEFEAALWRDLFTSRLKNEIPQAMKFLFAGVDLAGARLQYLDLSDNAIGPLGMTGLAPFFKSQSSFSLKVLICNNNGLGPQGAEEFSKALINCKHSSLTQGGQIFNLKTFVCGRNRMQNKGAVAISKFIKECTTLEEIHMPENSVYWQGQVSLAEAFAANPNLRVLNLNDNTIIGKGTRKLAEAFQQLVHLEDLNLGDCLLRSSGALFIVNTIKTHQNLRKLVLDGNEITKPTGVQIAEILRTSKSLRHLSLNSNPFGITGAVVIEGMLRQHCDTVEVDDPEDSEYEEEEVHEEEEADEEEDDDEEGAGDNESKEDIGEGEVIHGGDDDENYEDYGDDDYEEEEDPVENVMRFLQEPSLENYRAIPGGLSEYVYDLEYLDIPSHEICIQGAVGMIEYYGKKSGTVPKECQVIFSKLLNEAVNFASGGTNEFASALLVHLGISISHMNEYYREEVYPAMLDCLALWLINVVNEKDVEVPDEMLAYFHNSFQNVRPDLSVNKSKLSSLIDYVLWRRAKNANRSQK
ncbi:ran GTPase-activating protein 1 [Folsomia candida]|uniref:Ran GTPase-activating protein n=1 Tax=Folsomia candida TaxID=158441 RepID=A0A226EZL1_FOLCA|nr:ran GTPase-activating protein 1 [Folsomia candida]OXA62301.1 Ran GTPase-activating protein [Folsomia candida]